MHNNGYLQILNPANIEYSSKSGIPDRDKTRLSNKKASITA